MLVPLEKPSREVRFGAQERGIQTNNEEVKKLVKQLRERVNVIAKAFRLKQDEFGRYKDNDDASRARVWSGELEYGWNQIDDKISELENKLAGLSNKTSEYCKQVTKYFG